MLAGLYRTLTVLGSPFIRLYLQRRMQHGREDATRFHERLGQASVVRPSGRLIWCHAASVGEAASLLAVIGKLRDFSRSATILVTTGTVASAGLMRERLPEGCIHQYIPVDLPRYVKTFLDHWRPDFAIWIESELWPNILEALRERTIPAVLVNGRISERSFRNWRLGGNWSSKILSVFDLCLMQTEADVARFRRLGAKNVRCFGNIKFAALPLPYDPNELALLKRELDQDARAPRPVWVMASTHAGEEDLAQKTHQKLREKWPNILTIIVPRHVRRSEEIFESLHKNGERVARRSKKEAVKAETTIYLADTMGELGLFYRLSPIVAMGGSFVPVGGHNPIEPAQLGAAVIVGPHMQNFARMIEDFEAAHAILPVSTLELPAAIEYLLNDPAARARLASAAQDFVNERQSILDHLISEISPWLQSSERVPA